MFVPISTRMENIARRMKGNVHMDEEARCKYDFPEHFIEMCHQQRIETSRRYE